jgi:hypothetical protein
MASVSYQLKPGAVSMFEDDIAVGAAAPTTAGNVEIRVDMANAPTRKDIEMVLKAFIDRLKGERFGSADFGHV